MLAEEQWNESESGWFGLDPFAEVALVACACPPPTGTVYFPHPAYRR